MIIDAHVHVTENGKWFNTHHDASLERLILSLEESGIDKAVVLPIAPFVSNQFVARVCSEYPDRLMGFASVNPLERDAADILVECIENGLKGLKLHPKLQKFQLSDLNAQKVIEKAADLKIPVVIDAWVQPEDSVYQHVIHSIAATARRIPHAHIILTHLGGYKYNEILPVSKETKNIYFDLSFVMAHVDHETLYNYIAPLIREIGADHLIYGSDYPEIDIKNYYLFAQKFLDDFFSRKEKNLILGDNILRLTQQYEVKK
jgi:predicted TIM-barrel fold metal-dependent hydrolase